MTIKPDDIINEVLKKRGKTEDEAGPTASETDPAKVDNSVSA